MRVTKTLPTIVLASEGTLLNLIVSSPVLYFLKNDVGKDKTRIIVASVTDFSILIEILVLTKDLTALTSNKPVAAATTYMETKMNWLMFLFIAASPVNILVRYGRIKPTPVARPVKSISKIISSGRIDF